MFISKRDEFADAVAVTTSAGQLGNHVNLGGDFDIGPGRTLYLVLQVMVAATDTFTVALETDSDSGFATDLATIATITVAENDPAGTRYFIGFPSANLQFLRVYQTPADSDGAVTLSAWLTDQHPSAWQAYNNNIPT